MLVTVTFLGIAVTSLPNPEPFDTQLPLNIIYSDKKIDDNNYNNLSPIDLIDQSQKFEHPLHLQILAAQQLDPKMTAGLQGTR